MVFNQKYGKFGHTIVTGLNGCLKMGLPRAEFECRFWDQKLVVFFVLGLIMNLNSWLEFTHCGLRIDVNVF